MQLVTSSEYIPAEILTLQTARSLLPFPGPIIQLGKVPSIDLIVAICTRIYRTMQN